MKKTLYYTIFILLLSVVFVFSSFNSVESSATINKNAKDSITWYSWEEAIKLNDSIPKKLFIDVYTDWCGWCKRMDATTFKDSAVVEIMNRDFYAIKLDAEMKENVVFKGYTFKFDPKLGRRGCHELAASLLENRMSYPSFVAMDEEVRRITIISGYQEANPMQKILSFLAEEKYKTMSYKDYVDSLKK